jgi:hypothetical protein
MEIYEKMKQIAVDNNVEITENAIKIARFRERAGLSINLCPCAKDEPYPIRGCIGDKCREEIIKNGICKCGVYKKK